jgi:predicted kinase
MPKITMLRGLPASGKTTHAMQMVHTQRVKRINKDALRKMIDGGVYSKSNEIFITQVRDAIIQTSVNNDFDVVVDDTNLARNHEPELAQLAEHLAAEFEVIDFDTPLEECIERDANREDSVGEEVIRRMHRTHYR